jgi:hypothetical protein
MKKNTMTLMAAGVCAAVVAQVANAAVNTTYYSTNFGTGYVNGALAGTAATANSEGQNGWKQTSTANATPIQITSGAAIIGTSGQDIYHAFDSTASATAGTTLFVGASLKVTAAQSGGDYFLNVGDPVGTTSSFFGRVSAKSTAGGFLLGIQSTSGTGSAVTYGTTVLTLNQTYNVVYAYDFVAGALNDTFALYVDPNSATRASLTAYVSAAWLSSSVAEPAQLTEICLRQGSSSAAPSVSVYSLAASNNLAAFIPAPGAVALIGLAGMVGSRRRRN